jgi:hypothetical protein
MNSILKFLIAAACICVIGVSGHYAYSMYRASVADRAEVEKSRDRAAAALMAAQEKTQRLVEAENERKEAERALRKQERERKRREFLERVESRKLERAKNGN